MKRFLSLVMMLVMLLAVTPLDSQAQVSQSSLKAAKARAKELKKEKWYCEDNKTLEEALVYMAEKEGQGYRVIIGTAYGIDNQNDANFDARDDAYQKVGELGKSVIKGRIASNRQKRNDKTSRNSEAAYDRNLVRELEGVMDAPYLTIYREKNGNFDCRIYYVVQSTLIDKAIQKAEDNALKEVENAQKYGESIDNFISGSNNAD